MVNSFYTMNAVLKELAIDTRLTSYGMYHSEDKAAYVLRLRKNDWVVSALVDYAEPKELIKNMAESFILHSSRLYVRDILGDGIMMLEMDQDHGNGD